MANVTWTIGSHRLVYQYMKAKDGGQQDANAALTPESPECDLNAIGWQYDFSRRTFLLVQYVRIRNNATATCTFGQNPLAIAAGQDPRGASIGLRHIF
jgi:predicted porin